MILATAVAVVSIAPTSRPATIASDAVIIERVGIGPAQRQQPANDVIDLEALTVAPGDLVA